jgi:aminoglycoside phosphotransferase (APT) family kinase protein
VDADDRDWLAQHGSRIEAVGELAGGITSLMLALKLDGRELVLRRIDKRPWLQHADALLTREASTMQTLREIDRDPPAFAPSFIHRDFHLGNVLWDEGAISGVVDWVETSTGPVDLDVAHCCTNLAMTHGGDAPQRFRDAYRRAGGTLTDDPYWVLLDAVGFLPAPVDRGPGPGWERLEAYVESSLRASSSRSW